VVIGAKMSYQAKTVYKNEKVVKEYDQNRLFSVKGWLTDRLEKKLVYKAIKRANILPPSKLLDVPCGTGRLSLFLAKKGFYMTGVDISPAMISQSKAKTQLIQIKTHTEFMAGDAESLPFSDSSFEAAISLRLFGHLPTENRHNVLKELNRVSSSFVIVVYYHKNSLQTLRRKKMRARKGNFWNPVSLKQIDSELKAANLKCVAKFFLLPGISETVIVLAKKAKDC